MYETILAKLKTHPEFRERSKRSTGLAILALRANELEETYEAEPLSILELIEFASAYESYRRIWTLVLNENPDLRGTDWSDKTALEQEKQQELHYEGGFKENIKKLDTLT